jgi:hypothetical protein
MGLPVVTVATGGLPVAETTKGLPVSEAAKYGIAVTKVVGKPGLPVTYVAESSGGAAAAWTDFVATAPSGEGTAFVGAGTRKIYVSQSTGLDANPGTLASPKKTLSAGKAAMRAGSPDWLLLKNGDTWTDEAFDYFNNRSGVSAAAPALIGPWTFGGVRPLVKMNPSVNQGGFGLLGTSNFWVLYGIEFYAYTRDPANPSYNAATLATQLHGLDCTSSGTWLWVEDCKFSFSTGTTVQLVSATVTLFRNVFADNYWSAGHSNNFFDGVSNLTNKENVYAHNGWNATAGVPRDVFCHGWYFQYTAGNAGTHVGNVVAQAGANGAQCRPGGTITNNLFAGNPIGLLTGGGESTNGTQGGDVSSNVVVEGIDPSGWGIDVHACNATVRVFNNIIANDSASPAQDPNTVAIQLQTGTTADEATNNIIYHWGINAIVNSGAGNIVTGNAIDGTGYGAPTRTLSMYDSAVLGGPGTIDHFLTLARAQSRNSYNTALTADGVNTWIRAGFGL